MRVLQQVAEALRYEMDNGRGGDRLWPFPVPLEPLFARFSVGDGGRRTSPTGTDTEPGADTPLPLADLVFLAVKPSKDDEYGAGLGEQLLLALSPRRPLAFEVVSRGGAVALQFVAAAEDAASVRQQLSAHYPRAQVCRQDDLLRQRGVPHLVARCYRLRDSHLFTLRMQHAVETYAALAGILAGLDGGQIGLFQVLFQSVRHPWRDNILSVACDPWDPAKSPFLDLPDLPKRARAKVERPLFAVAVRLAASSGDLLDRIEGCFLSQFEGEDNALVPVASPYPEAAILGRYTHTSGMLLNAQELAALVHLPDPESLAEGVLELASLTAPAPQSAAHSLVAIGTNRHQ